MIVFAVVIHVSVWWMYSHLRNLEMREDVRRTRILAPSPIPPQPKLQVDPQAEWNEYRSSQLELLSGYGWISREAGRVRIPIDRAMELAAEGEASR
jgi:hypothetical protein